jgi:hypothetical protein
MALPLTGFKTVPVSVTGVDTLVYTAPVGYVAIVLTAQAVNTGASNQFFSMNLAGSRSGSPFTQSIVNNYNIPAHEVLIASGGTAGKLVLQTGDSLSVLGGTDIKFTLSVLETLV